MGENKEKKEREVLPSQWLAAPCGVYCGACCKFRVERVCEGCLADDKNKKCLIRKCAIKSSARFCYSCATFPCKYLTKFAEAGKNDAKLAFRSSTFDNLEYIKLFGINRFLETMEKKFNKGLYSIGENYNGKKR